MSNTFYFYLAVHVSDTGEYIEYPASVNLSAGKPSTICQYGDQFVYQLSQLLKYCDHFDTPSLYLSDLSGDNAWRLVFNSKSDTNLETIGFDFDAFDEKVLNEEEHVAFTEEYGEALRALKTTCTKAKSLIQTLKAHEEKQSPWEAELRLYIPELLLRKYI